MKKDFFTEKEKDFLKNLDSKFSYIVRSGLLKKINPLPSEKESSKLCKKGQFGNLTYVDEESFGVIYICSYTPSRSFNLNRWFPNGEEKDTIILSKKSCEKLGLTFRNIHIRDTKPCDFKNYID